MTKTEKLDRKYRMKYFGSMTIDYNHPNYKLYSEKMRAWYTSSERYWLAFEEAQKEAVYEKDQMDIDCEKYHAWKDEQL